MTDAQHATTCSIGLVTAWQAPGLPEYTLLGPQFPDPASAARAARRFLPHDQWGVFDASRGLVEEGPGLKAGLDALAAYPGSACARLRRRQALAAQVKPSRLVFPAAGGGQWQLTIRGARQALHDHKKTAGEGLAEVCAALAPAPGLAAVEQFRLLPLQFLQPGGQRLWQSFASSYPALVKDYEQAPPRGCRAALLAELLERVDVAVAGRQELIATLPYRIGLDDRQHTALKHRNLVLALIKAGTPAGPARTTLLGLLPTASHPTFSSLAAARALAASSGHLPGCAGTLDLYRDLKQVQSHAQYTASMAALTAAGYGCSCQLALLQAELACLTRVLRATRQPAGDQPRYKLVALRGTYYYSIVQELQSTTPGFAADQQADLAELVAACQTEGSWYLWDRHAEAAGDNPVVACGPALRELLSQPPANWWGAAERSTHAQWRDWLGRKATPRRPAP